MLNPLSVPLPVEQKLEELNQLVEQYPLYIPVSELATFLGAHAEGLRASLEHGQCPFGFPWQKDVHGYRAFKVPTVPFYLWYTQGGPFRWQVEREAAQP